MAHPPAGLSASREAEIRQREAKATKGPWQVDHHGDFRCECDPEDAEFCGAHHVRKISISAPYDAMPHSRQLILGRGAYSGHLNAEEDAAFAAHARTDIPDLLAELSRLRAALAEHDRVAKAATDDDGKMFADRIRTTILAGDIPGATRIVMDLLWLVGSQHATIGALTAQVQAPLLAEDPRHG